VSGRPATEVNPVRTWLLLAYKVPREPTAGRVFVWRKLKRLGALPLQDAVWVLPASAPNREQFQWLATEIEVLEGEATLWEARLTIDGHEASVVRQFVEQSETAYRAILAALAGPEPDLPALSRQYQQAVAQDFFRSPVGGEARDALVQAGGQANGGGKRR